MNSDYITAGRGVELGVGVALRLVPVSGPASWPRLVQIGRRKVIFDGPGLKPVQVDGSITITPAALPFAPPAGMHAVDPEVWFYELAEDECEARLLAPDPPVSPVQIYSQDKTWADTEFFPIIDTRPFSRVVVQLMPHATATQNAGLFIALNSWDLAGNRASNAVTTLNPGDERMGGIVLDRQASQNASLAWDVGISVPFYGPFFAPQFKSGGGGGGDTIKKAHIEAWGWF